MERVIIATNDVDQAIEHGSSRVAHSSGLVCQSFPLIRVDIIALSDIQRDVPILSTKASQHINHATPT